MSTRQELFRFFTIRRAERLRAHRVNDRLIRDPRPQHFTLIDDVLIGASFEQRLANAAAYATTEKYVNADEAIIHSGDLVVDELRPTLAPGASVEELVELITNRLPTLAPVLAPQPPKLAVALLALLNARLWDSVYVDVTRGSAGFVTTNHLVDSLRLIQVLRVLWWCVVNEVEEWPGHHFDEYELLIELDPAAPPPTDKSPDLVAPQPVSVDRPGAADAATPVGGVPAAVDAGRASARLAQIDEAIELLTDAVDRGSVVASDSGIRLDAQAAKRLRSQPQLGRRALETETTETVFAWLRDERAMWHRRMLRETKDRRRPSPPRVTSEAIAHEAVVADIDLDAETELAELDAIDPADLPALPTAAAPRMLAANYGKYSVELERGEIRPPVVGDLVLVEQELLRYEMGEIAEIENVLAKEQKERTTRSLSQVTETSSTESENETETTESRTVDERFSLATEAQKSATQNFSVSAGVSASGKFGPMTVSAEANASFSTSKTSSETTSQEFARDVTEEASQTVRSLIKESSSLTILTENESTALHGINNDTDEHIIGIYRWVDKIYEARTMNYGRRLMLDLSVPEPAALLRGGLVKTEIESEVDMEEPVHPNRVNPNNLNTYTYPNENAVTSFADITTDNYAELVAFWDVVDIAPPPPNKITGAKTVVYPEAHTAAQVKDHTDEVNELSYVYGDTSLTVDPDYKLERVGVFAPKGKHGALGWYADTLELGTTSNKYNLLMVLVGTKSFYFYAEGPKDSRDIDSNFNQMEVIDDNDFYTGVVTPALPIQFSADFEGIANFTVVYTAFLRDDALDRWKQEVYAAIVTGYDRKKREYDEAVRAAEAKLTVEIEERESLLRDSQYREIELTEIKRGSIDILTRGTAVGHWSTTFSTNGDVEVIYSDDDALPFWTRYRSPLANGTVATFFENAFEWENTTYAFHPYYWTDSARWDHLLDQSSPDPIFEAFLKAGQARVVVPVRPGHERAVLYFLRTGLIWGGSYLPLFNTPEMLETYDDVEQGHRFEPPLQIGDSWEVTLPSSLVILQEDGVLPNFAEELESGEGVDDIPEAEPVPEPELEDAPF